MAGIKGPSSSRIVSADYSVLSLRTASKSPPLKLTSHIPHHHILAFAMRSTTVFSFLAAGLALLTQSPAAYAAPVPYEVDPAGVKSRCYMGSCKFAEPSPETDTVSTPASAANLLVKMLIETLENYQNITSTSSGTPPVNLATPVEPETVSPDDSPADTVVDPAVDTL